MHSAIRLQSYRPTPLHPLGPCFAGRSPQGDSLAFNNYYLEKNGAPFFAVSGEMHFSRMDARRWEDELIKLRMGGVNTVSTYLFWNHVEEEEGVFDFSGSRDLRRFVTLCQKHGLYVILRVGPFCHGEVRNGGLPDWLYGQPFEVRTTHPGFLACVRRLYAQIGAQVQGLFFQDGGPIIAVQLDNEYMSSSAPWEMTTGVSNEWVFGGDEGEKYILALRDIALECGLRPVFFTGTAWGGAAHSDDVLPLWGGYAYRPWLFYHRRGEHPATEEYIYQDYHRDGALCTDDFAPAYPPSSLPYACCEMGAGMMCCYGYRFLYPFKSVDALANVKLGSGCNFIGYYMFHGGTNPVGRSGVYLNESQVPKRSYDYQAALGEFGQVRESYRRLKSLHYFLRFFGGRLAPMGTVLPDGASQIDPGDLSALRFAVRTDGQSGFLFVNNFQDHRTMPDRQRDTVHIETAEDAYDFAFGIASEENAILPFHFDMDGILLEQAIAQPVLRTVIRGRATYVFLFPDCNGGALRFEKAAQVTGEWPLLTAQKGEKAVDILLLTREESNRLFILRDGSLILTDAALLEDEGGALRLETAQAENTLYCYPADRLRGAAQRLGDQGPWGVYQADTPEKRIAVACAPAAPCRWTVKLPENCLDGLKDALLYIDYAGDIGSLWLNHTLISDHFCNGGTWEVGLMELKDHLSEALTLKITPLKEDARVIVDSPMATRNEEAKGLVADLRQIRVQPVYEIRL